MNKKQKITVLVSIATIVVLLGLSLCIGKNSDPAIYTSSGLFYRSGNTIRTNPSLPITQGRVYSTTTTPLVSQNLLASELVGYSTINLTPVNASMNYNLPATSTLTSFIPQSGDYSDIVFKNASTTLTAKVGLVAGTGMTLIKATSTATTTGTGIIFTRFIRKANTDIDVYLNVGI